MESAGNVTISSITSTSVHIKWIIPKCVDRGSDILSYSCTLSEINTANKIKLETQFNFKLIQIGRLKPFTNYSTVVTITNDIGSGPSSSPIAFRTLEDVPGPQTIIKMTPLLNTAIVVAFAPPIDANELITKYRLSVEEEMTSYQIETDTDVTSATIKDLSAYISYHIKLSYHRGTEDSERIVIYRSHSTLSQFNVTGLDSGEYYYFRVQARTGAGYGPSVNQS